MYEINKYTIHRFYLHNVDVHNVDHPVSKEKSFRGVKGKKKQKNQINGKVNQNGIGRRKTFILKKVFGCSNFLQTFCKLKLRGTIRILSFPQSLFSAKEKVF